MTVPYTTYRRLYLKQLEDTFFQYSREKASYDDDEYVLFNMIRQTILDNKEKTNPRNIAGLLYRHANPRGVVNHVAMTIDGKGEKVPYTLLTMAIELKAYQLLDVFMPYLNQTQKNLLLMTEGTKEESFGCFQPMDIARRLINAGANPHGIIEVNVPQKGKKELFKKGKNTPFMFFFERHEQPNHQNRFVEFKFPFPDKDFIPFAEFYSTPHSKGDKTFLTHKNEDGETLFSLMIKYHRFKQAMLLLNFLKDNPTKADFYKAVNFSQVKKHFNMHYEQNRRFFHRFYQTNKQEFIREKKLQLWEEKIYSAIQLAEKYVLETEQKNKQKKKIEQAQHRAEEKQMNKIRALSLTQGELDFSQKEKPTSAPLQQGLFDFSLKDKISSEENHKTALRYATTAAALIVAGSVASPLSTIASERPKNIGHHSLKQKIEQKAIQQLLPGFEKD